MRLAQRLVQLLAALPEVKTPAVVAVLAAEVAEAVVVAPQRRKVHNLRRLACSSSLWTASPFRSLLQRQQHRPRSSSDYDVFCRRGL